MTEQGRRTWVLRLAHDALQLSAHVLRGDARQLPSQLLGRLLGEQENRVATLLQTARRVPRGPWLRPLAAALMPPGGPLLLTLTGHTGRVVAAAVTPDGARALSGCDDGSLKVWDLESAQEILALPGHATEIQAVAMSADGRRAVSAADDGTLKAWDVESGRLLWGLQAHGGGWEDRIRAVAVTPDGRWAVSASADGTVKVWNLDRAEESARFAHPSLRAVVVTVDGQRLLSMSHESVKVWDLALAREVKTLLVHPNLPVSARALTADGKLLLVACDDGALEVFDLDSGRKVRSLSGNRVRATSLAVTPDGSRAVLGSVYHLLVVWDLRHGGEQSALRGHADEVWAVAITADGRKALSGSWDRTLRLWDLESDRREPELPPHPAIVSAVAMARDGKRAVSVSWEGTLVVWDLGTADTVRRSETLELGERPLLFSVQAAALTSDGKCVLLGGDPGGKGERGGFLMLLDLATHESLWRVEIPGLTDLESASLRSRWLSAGQSGLPTGEVQCVALTPDGRRALSGSGDGKLRLWDSRSGELLHTLAAHSSRVTAVAVTPEGEQAVSGDQDGTMKVWSLRTSEELRRLAGGAEPIQALFVLPDGRRAVSGSTHGVALWDLETGRELAALDLPEAALSGVAADADGRNVVVSTRRHTVEVWSLADQVMLTAFTGESGMSAMACSAEGAVLVVGETSGRVHFLRAEGS